MRKGIKAKLISLVAVVMIVFSILIACGTNLPVDSVTLDITSKSLKVGGSVQLVATVVVPDETTDKAVKWKSSKTSVASVDENGVVTAKSVGSTTVTATSIANSSKKATCEIIVTEANAAYKNAGTYKVGTDIEAGEYLLITDKQNHEALSFGYYQVTTSANPSVTSDEFLYNDNFFYRSYVLLFDGEYIKFSSCKLFKIEDYPAIDKNAESWHAGQYKVGVDIEPGDYKLTTLASDSILNNGYLEITKTPNASVGSDDFISNNFFDNQAYVTLEANTYIEFNKATLERVS